LTLLEEVEGCFFGGMMGESLGYLVYNISKSLEMSVGVTWTVV
jgi:hypothetical protein